MTWASLHDSLDDILAVVCSCGFGLSLAVAALVVAIFSLWSHD